MDETALSAIETRIAAMRDARDNALAYLASAEIVALQAPDLVAEIRRLRAALREIEQVLGKALGYPLYGPEMFPDGVPDGSVCVGDHVPESLADEAAARIGALTRERDEARAENKRLRAELAMVREVAAGLARDLAERQATPLMDALLERSD